MAERLKEFFNGSFDINDFITGNNSLDLLATDASTQKVLRDISFNDVIDGSVSIKVNGHVVYSGDLSVSGSEIIDVNSSVTIEQDNLYELLDGITIAPIQYDTSADKFFYTDPSTAYTMDSHLNDGSIVTNSVSNPNGVIGEYVFNDAGDLYVSSIEHGNPHASRVYKLSGGMAGTAVDLNFTGDSYYLSAVYAKDKGKYYGVRTGSLWEYDINTDTETQLPVTGAFASNGSPAYAKLYYANNKLFYAMNGGYLYVVDLSTMSSTELSRVSGLSTAEFANKLTYWTNTDDNVTFIVYFGGKYVVGTHISPTGAVITLCEFDDDFKKLSETGSLSYIDPRTTTQRTTNVEQAGDFVFQHGYNANSIHIGVINLRTLSVEKVVAFTNPYGGPSNEDSRWQINPKTLSEETAARKLAVYPGKVSIRVTGVEITEVV
jgi:hypothetical protein